ncbi:MAG: BON domain-containing protein [Burkholderiaceae bacterium]|jgi:osmotically-inducible protein OsmY
MNATVLPPDQNSVVPSESQQERITEEQMREHIGRLAPEIAVIVHGNIAYLKGTCRSADERQAVLEIAWLTDGVVKVVDEMSLEGN